MKPPRPSHQDLLRWLVVLVSLCLVALIGWVDYVIGWELGLFTVYSLPIALVVWKTDRRIAYVFAFLCTFAWWFSAVGNNPYQSTLGFALAVASRWFYFVIFAIAATAAKDFRKQGLARIEQLERAQELEQQILKTSELERQRIGHDLHDNLGPHLAAIGYAASFLASDLRQRELPEAAQAEQIRVLITDAIKLTRDLALEIFPVQMEGDGLSQALWALTCTMTANTDIDVTYHESGNAMINDPELSMHLYRIAQEALNNATKHAAAKKISIALSHSLNSLCLVVTDDGKGILPDVNARQGMGLHSMRYRARMAGGDLRIDSSPGLGTVVTCEISKPFKLIKN